LESYLLSCLSLILIHSLLYIVALVNQEPVMIAHLGSKALLFNSRSREP